MMVAASNQLAELLDDVGLVARIESGRWEPNVQEVDSLELAAQRRRRRRGASVDGDGGQVRVDRDAAETALRQLARCALRHGGLQELDVTVAGEEIAISPVTEAAAPILLGQQARDLGALIARRIVAALGGSVELEGRPPGRPSSRVVPVSASRVSLLRWLRRQLRQPVALREHLEAAVQNDDPAEARRLVEQMPDFSDAQRRHVLALVEAWEEERANEGDATTGGP